MELGGNSLLTCFLKAYQIIISPCKKYNANVDLTILFYVLCAIF